MSHGPDRGPGPGCSSPVQSAPPDAGTVLYLDVDEQLPQVPRLHHHGGVQLCDVALVQSNVIVSREALQERRGCLNSKKGAGLRAELSAGRCLHLPSESRG